MNPEAIIMDFSSRIRLERQKRSWTQEQLAERAKLSTRTVRRIESGDEAAAETLRDATKGVLKEPASTSG